MLVKNYIIKSATINLEDDNFISSIPTQLLKEQGLSLIPSQAYTILLECSTTGEVGARVNTYLAAPHVS